MLLNCGSTCCKASFAVIADKYQVFGSRIGGCTAVGTIDLCQLFCLFVRCDAVAKNSGIAAIMLPKATVLSKEPFGTIIDR